MKLDNMHVKNGAQNWVLSGHSMSVTSLDHVLNKYVLYDLNIFLRVIFFFAVFDCILPVL